MTHADAAPAAAGDRVFAAQLVEHGAVHAVARIVVERDAARAIEAARRLDEREEARGVEILELHVRWKSAQQAERDAAHEARHRLIDGRSVSVGA